MINLIPDPRLPFIAPPLASTKKLTKKPIWVGIVLGLMVGQLVVDGLSGEYSKLFDGKDKEVVVVLGWLDISWIS